LNEASDDTYLPSLSMLEMLGRLVDEVSDATFFFGKHVITAEVPVKTRNLQFTVIIQLTYNPSYSACFFFQSEQYFSLKKNQPTVFFNRLIIPAERLLCHQNL
jgi:hypothetical protein